ncbi:MAG: Transcription factor iws1 [Chrysothrix sp. TS-e1954]|nr:MAG: Transcription factor iws1 [Chrysothrix sp. TS-e1954]
MEDLGTATTPPDSPLPEGNADPGDPLRPEVEEEDAAATPPLADPTNDMDANEDGVDNQADGNASDDESVLSEIDEAQFADFDPNAIAIEERKEVPIDESNVNQLQSHKRKRTEGEEEKRKKRKKEGRREKKPKKRKTRDEEDDDFMGGDTIEGKRTRKRKEIVPDRDDGISGGIVRKEKPRARERQVENEAELAPEERRKRALDRKIDEALKNPNRRGRRLGGIDLEAAADELIESLRQRMGQACQLDSDARQEIPPRPATHKLAMLKEVGDILNRNTLREQVVDPDTNLLQAVRFFLEPLQDGSLPAYDIQRVIFQAMTRLPIGKDALIASGIGKVTLFYTKSKRPEPKIKRTAEKLLGEWTRPILKRTDDYRKRELQTAHYDPLSSSRKAAPADPDEMKKRAEAARRERMLATPTNSNRARHDGQVGSYSIVPKSNLMVGMEDGGRNRGRAAEEVFRRIKSGAAGGVARR